jgi:nicotinic acid phosphoribosyltransferase
VYKLVEVEGEPRIKVREAEGQRKTNT